MKIDELLNSLPSDNFGKGDAFEKLVKWWLQNDSVWKGLLKPNTVKLWNESPHRQGRDIGIDLTAEDYLGHVWAIQAKNWKEETSLPKSEIDKFLSASNTRKFQKRLLVTTTSSISSNALSAMDNQEKEAKKVTIHDLRESNVEWQLYLDNPKANATKAIKIPFPHQKDAIKNTVKGFKENKRGQLIMACGSGKTITAQRIDEELESKLTLVLVPSLLLVQQTLKSWREETRKDFLSMAVCSDDTVTNDSAVGKVSDLSIPVTTDSKEIKEFLKLKGRKVIFSTYQSSSKIAKAIKGTKYKFDLIIADEAHRLAGTVDKEYGAVLQKNALPSKHYLFMTATPRIFTANVQKTASERGVEVYSMDDESIFGKQLHNYSFADAIRDGVLTDYRVVVVGVDDPMLADMIDQRELVSVGDIDTDAKTLASHIGLAKAMRDYKLNRVISFHSRIKSAKNFAENHPKIRDWMKEPNIKSTNLTTLTISGQDSSDARKTVLDQLKEVDKDSQGLVTNARCLTEGVDVPTLDGIAFIDPRASQVDIVQAVGRAIRRGGDEKKFGYIIIPIFFSQEEIDEEIINESSFKPIWHVINALKSHDSKLAEEIDELRISMGKLKTPQNISEKITLDIPLKIDIDFVNKIRINIMNHISDSWLENFGLLERFILQNNHARPVFSRDEENYPGLSRWVANQRNQYKRKSMDLKRIDMLNKSHSTWLWDPFENDWNNGYEELLLYIKNNGHTKVPSHFKTHNGFNLGVWLVGQRILYKNNELGKARIELLENSSDDWAWDILEANWNSNYQKLKRFIEVNHHAEISRPKNKLLSYFIMTQRLNYKKGLLSEERIKLMEELGSAWSWDPLWEKWESQLKEYLKISKKKLKSDDPRRIKIQSWITAQRRHYKNGTLEKRKIDFIENSISQWQWDPMDDKWSNTKNELQKYLKNFGNLRVPKDYVTPEGYMLGAWVSRIRVEYNKGKLNEERIRFLESLDKSWIWRVPIENIWYDNYELLLLEIANNGSPNFADNYKPITKLNVKLWLQNQRSSYNRNKLDEDKIKLLETSHRDWDWDPFESAWEEQFQTLKTFYSINKFIPTNKSTIGNWVIKQKKLFRTGKLTKQRIERLEKDIPNWIWGDKKEARWETNFQEFQKYVNETGSCQIDKDYKNNQGIALGSWTYTQRSTFKQGKLEKDRIKKLEGLKGWKWDLGSGGR